MQLAVRMGVQGRSPPRRRSRSRDRSRDRRRRRSRSPDRRRSRDRRRRSPSRERRCSRDRRRQRSSSPKEKPGFQIKLCPEEDHLANSFFECGPNSTIADIKRHLAPLCAHVPGFLGEADIIIWDQAQHKLFNAMTASEAGLEQGSMIHWSLTRRSTANEAPETEDQKKERLEALEQQFGGTADPCTDRGFWLGEQTEALRNSNTQDDWFCGGCHVHNFGSRSRCCGCNLPKPSLWAPA